MGRNNDPKSGPEPSATEPPEGSKALVPPPADLEVELLQGQNTALVDLFDPRHARKVLTAFGQARDDTDVRCVVLASTHPTVFSSGGDLARFATADTTLFPRLFELIAQLGGETLTITILFSDIRSFTTISEKMDAHSLVRLLNFPLGSRLGLGRKSMSWI